jgi:hypothetical protein
MAFPGGGQGIAESMLCGSGLRENVTAVLDQLALSSEVLGEEIVKEWLAACFVLRWSNCFLA